MTTIPSDGCEWWWQHGGGHGLLPLQGLKLLNQLFGEIFDRSAVALLDLLAAIGDLRVSRLINYKPVFRDGCYTISGYLDQKKNSFNRDFKGP
jgi:hypothetical protein